MTREQYQRELDRHMVQLDAELATRRLIAEIELQAIRAQQNRELWYLAGMLAWVAFKMRSERCKR